VTAMDISIYGIRDCAFRDPAGPLIRLQELR
jgi:hypothetical protein